jgi:hypothetical protein
MRQIKSRRMRWVGHVARMGEERKVYNVLVGKPDRKRPLERPRHRREDGIRMDLREIASTNLYRTLFYPEVVHSSDFLFTGMNSGTFMSNIHVMVLIICVIGVL